MSSTSGQTRSGDARARQQQSSHMLKTGRRGNPFCKALPASSTVTVGLEAIGKNVADTGPPCLSQDTHDLFATLMVSLDLSDRTRFFRTYPNSFTTDDAAANLSSLRFSQSNRTSDPNDPQRIVTTTTTTTFSMSRDIAKGICQHFMDARLIENAADPSSATFKDRGIYQITPKGLHVLERFITKNGISADHLVTVFTTQPICMKLLHLERRQSDDEIHVSRSVIDVVFRRFAGGRHPNYVADPHDSRGIASVARPYIDNLRPGDGFDRSAGIELQDVTEKGKTGTLAVTRQVFNSVSAIDWLVDFSTCCCREEAGELLAHFVRYGLIVLHLDRSKAGDRVGLQEVRGTGTSEAEYRYGPRVLYRVTDEGRRTTLGVEGAVATAVPKSVSVAMEGKNSSEGSVDDDASSTKSGERPTDRSFTGGTGLNSATESQITNRPVVGELFKADFSDSGVAAWSKDQHSTTTRLRAILDEPALRALFRDFLRANYCDENLGFWIDVADFRRRFSTTSSAVGGSGQVTTKRKQGTATNAMETHQQNLVAAALHIYNTYLAPLSPNELNIDHNLRADVVNYVNRSLADVAPPGGPKPVVPGEEPEVPALRATQVQTLLRQYERIQEHIFRLLATDQVPRFVRTEPFLALIDPETQDSASNTTTTDVPSPASTQAAGTAATGKAV
ncbi:GTPase-activating protein SST2, partial [Phenoliferia sp. Uapishka_3]